MAEKSYRDAIRDAMMEEMDRDPNVLIMGEDIGVYEGTFRITAGMLKKYGPKRVIDTPIAEAGMAGTAGGGGGGGVRPAGGGVRRKIFFLWGGSKPHKTPKGGGSFGG